MIQTLSGNPVQTWKLPYALLQDSICWYRLSVVLHTLSQMRTRTLHVATGSGQWVFPMTPRNGQFRDAWLQTWWVEDSQSLVLTVDLYWALPRYRFRWPTYYLMFLPYRKPDEVDRKWLPSRREHYYRNCEINVYDLQSLWGLFPRTTWYIWIL